MKPLESRYNEPTNSVMGLRSSTRTHVWDVLYTGAGALIGYSVALNPVLGTVIGGVSGFVAGRILKNL